MGLSPEEYRKTISDYPLDKRIAIITDFDLTITETFQQEPILAAYFDNIKKAYDGKTIRTIIDGKLKESTLNIESPLDWFDISDSWAQSHNGVAWVSQFLLDMENGVFPQMSKKDLQETWAQGIKMSPGIPQLINEIREEFEGKCYIGFYIASVGITDLILGTEIGKMADWVYASELVSLKTILNSSNVEDQYVMPVDSARDIIKPFGKTECVIKIAKGSSERLDDLVRNDDLLFSYSHFIYIGDGTSDVSTFAYLQKKGSTLVCVYEESNMAAYEMARTHPHLLPRIHGLFPRDYQTSSPTYDQLVKITNRILSKKCKFPSQILDLKKKRRLNEDIEEHRGILKEIKKHIRHCNECKDTHSPDLIQPK